MAKKFYAVKIGRMPGIYKTWAECEAQTKGFQGAVFKGFATLEEANEFYLGESAEKTSTETKTTTATATPNDGVVYAWTDGACSGNPGPGGWGAILRMGNYEKEFSGGAPDTTNNRMELTAVIEALSALKKPCTVNLTTDSKYVCDAINKGWVYGWQKKDWKKSDGSAALNVDLWERLLPLLKTHKVTFNWVKGHAGHPENERCDRLAVAQRDANNQ